jgi:hypothetical protein
MRTNRLLLQTALGCLLAGVVSNTTGGCADLSTCDPGQELVGGMCQPIFQDAGEDAAGREFICEDTDPMGGEYGAACIDGEEHTDCACPAPVCAKQETAAQGFCTSLYCDEPGNECPSGWRCTDVSELAGMTVPMTCLPSG